MENNDAVIDAFRDLVHANKAAFMDILPNRK